MTATEAARRFSEVLNRVSAGEQFEIVRAGAPVAVIGPPRTRFLSAERFRALLESAPETDDSFAGDVRAIRDELDSPRTLGGPSRYGRARRLGTRPCEPDSRSACGRRGARDQRDHRQRALARRPSREGGTPRAATSFRRARPVRPGALADHGARRTRSRRDLGWIEQTGSGDRRSRPLDRGDGADPRPRPGDPKRARLPANPRPARRRR